MLHTEVLSILASPPFRPCRVGDARQMPFARLETLTTWRRNSTFSKVEMVLIYPRLIGRDGCDGASL